MKFDRIFRAGSARVGDYTQPRTIQYVFSDASVGRDNHVITPNAWDTTNFQRNPVFLWAHQSDEPPIGRVVGLQTVNGELVGGVEFADRDTYPFADTIYQLTAQGFLNASSTSWIPLEGKRSNDPQRAGGYDFTSVELLEISAVPVPALPTALVTARAAGIDTRPLYEWAERALDEGWYSSPRDWLENLRKESKMPAKKRADGGWKCGAARDLPIEDGDSAWDGSAAQASIFEWAGGDNFDADKAKKGFLAYDSSASDKRGSYKLPFARVSGGKLVVPKSALRAASGAHGVQAADIGGAKSEAQSVLDAYKKKAGIGEDNQDSGSDDAKRSIPLHKETMTKLRAWLDEGSAMLLDMENKAASDPEGVEELVARGVAKAILGAGLVRAGKMFSADNERCMRAALDLHDRACGMVRDMLAQNNDDDGDETDDDKAELEDNAKGGEGGNVNPTDAWARDDEMTDEYRALAERKKRAAALRTK